MDDSTWWAQEQRRREQDKLAWEEAERERQCRHAVDDLIRDVIVDSLEGKGSEGSEGSEESEGSDESEGGEGGEDSEGDETTINQLWARVGVGA